MDAPSLMFRLLLLFARVKAVRTLSLALLPFTRRGAKLMLLPEQRSSIDTESTSEKRSRPGPILTSAQHRTISGRQIRKLVV